MAYDEDLANRIREIVQDEPGLTEKRMLGGLAFLINGNMAVSASAIAPGLTITDMVEEWNRHDPGVIERIIAGTPLGGPPHRRRSPRRRSGCSAIARHT